MNKRLHFGAGLVELRGNFRKSIYIAIWWYGWSFLKAFEQWSGDRTFHLVEDFSLAFLGLATIVQGKLVWLR